MKNIMSNADDCYQLAVLLQSKLKNKLNIIGSARQEVISGSFRSFSLSTYRTIEDFEKDELAFAFKFCKNGFLRIQVGRGLYNRSMGHKLAALSDFYEVIKELYGEPTMYYTTKDDDEEMIALQWCFCDTLETIESFQNNTVFDDADVDEVVIINDPKRIPITLTDHTKSLLSKGIGLPFELIKLIDENIDDYIYYKTGETKDVRYKSYTTLTELTNPQEKKLELTNPTNK